MKTINVTYIGHPTNAKLRPTVPALIQAVKSVLSDEIDTTHAFIYESDPMFIYMLLKQLLSNSENDQFIITDEVTCSLIQLLDQAYFDNKLTQFNSKYILVQFSQGELKSFNQTLGVYNRQVHYTNVYNQKGPALIEALRS